MEAQRFPGDFDGILAGDPANAWSRMLAAGVGWYAEPDAGSEGVFGAAQVAGNLEGRAGGDAMRRMA